MKAKSEKFWMEMRRKGIKVKKSEFYELMFDFLKKQGELERFVNYAKIKYLEKRKRIDVNNIVDTILGGDIDEN